MIVTCKAKKKQQCSTTERGHYFVDHLHLLLLLHIITITSPFIEILFSSLLTSTFTTKHISPLHSGIIMGSYYSEILESMLRVKHG